MTGVRGRRRKQLLDNLKETRGYCKSKEEALVRTVWRTGFGRGYRPVLDKLQDEPMFVCSYSIVHIP